jgi:hypothetical protein
LIGLYRCTSTDLRNNQELEEILRGEDIAKFVKYQRLAWLGHVERMDEERMSRKLLHAKMEGRRRRGRPRKRWLQSLEEDMRIMQVGRCRVRKNGGAL